MNNERRNKRPGLLGLTGQVFAVVVGVVLALLALLATGGIVAWHLLGELSPDALRAWALVATLLLPVVTWGGYRLAHAEARGRLQGIDDAMDKIMTAATKAIDLKVTNITKTKEVMQPAPNIVMLPNPGAGFMMRPQLTDGDDIIEM